MKALAFLALLPSLAFAGWEPLASPVLAWWASTTDPGTAAKFNSVQVVDFAGIAPPGATFARVEGNTVIGHSDQLGTCLFDLWTRHTPTSPWIFRTYMTETLRGGVYQGGTRTEAPGGLRTPDSRVVPLDDQQRATYWVTASGPCTFATQYAVVEWFIP